MYLHPDHPPFFGVAQRGVVPHAPLSPNLAHPWWSLPGAVFFHSRSRRYDSMIEARNRASTSWVRASGGSILRTHPGGLKLEVGSASTVDPKWLGSYNFPAAGWNNRAATSFTMICRFSCYGHHGGKDYDSSVLRKETDYAFDFFANNTGNARQRALIATDGTTGWTAANDLVIGGASTFPLGKELTGVATWNGSTLYQYFAENGVVTATNSNTVTGTMDTGTDELKLYGNDVHRSFILINGKFIIQWIGMAYGFLTPAAVDAVIRDGHEIMIRDSYWLDRTAAPPPPATGQPTMRRWGGVPGMQYSGRRGW